ncbi:MAG: hypothetical protein ACOYOU_18695 [Kiritimatiellia bacterium]
MSDDKKTTPAPKHNANNIVTNREARHGGVVTNKEPCRVRDEVRPKPPTDRGGVKDKP